MSLDIESVKKRLGEVVKEKRELCGLSQTKLAELSGIHRTHVAGVESGGKNLTVESLLRLSESLGTLPSKLLKESGC
ncbi:helix-turn-helix transcriptional regulator [Pelagicoccus sp. SDUM812003]|uniref:helix-turn-helix domain-containing protein n=1 Tax=Pelagicoccus sp. SDUM812003 TaxID=3041267 RepID=UPI0028109ADE|nr:helix-turn-helix transcriptional regulator [Pelagicoccus sp. SDUM812003]MDQ8202791.1 helix-turn-helix transcriptional regulator [Pelagicoccus sp. SDUM812003]